MMKFKYDSTRLLVKDFKACFKFYRDVMGFKPTYGMDDEVYAHFDTGSMVLALFERKLMSAAVGTEHLPFDLMAQDKVCLVLVVDDVDAAFGVLKQRGAQSAGEPEDHLEWDMRSAYIRDPDGNLIEIYQPLPQS
jgi:lactoylglutathione lyase